MEMEYTCAWALHNLGAICDEAGLWFTESQRKAFGEIRGRINLSFAIFSSKVKISDIMSSIRL